MTAYFDWNPANIAHLAEHGVTPVEFEQAFHNTLRYARSRSSGLPALFGVTDAGRGLYLAYEIEVGDECDWVIPVTAFDADL